MRTPGQQGRKASMSESKLPEHPSLEYLRKIAKDRLKELRRRDSQAKLAAAQLAVAREYGFTSWRALKAEVDRREHGSIVVFFDACAAGDLARIREMVDRDP